MKARMMRGVGAVAIALSMATSGFAQQSTNRVAANTDWSVFVEADECWGVSSPKETVNTKDGKPVQVRRGDVLLFVTYRAGGAKGEISFSGGYPFAEGSTVKMTLDSGSFELFTDGEWAWPANPEDDAKILAAMKSGTQAVMTARSGKGTNTKDSFSLLGFTASVTEAEKRCAK